MAVTRLDWDVFTYGTHPRLTPFPWITGRVRKGDAHTVLDELCRRFNNEVEKINPKHSWGWAYRPVRGATSVSEHAAGTALDLNAPKHPLGRQGTFTSSQVNSIHRILRDLDGAVRWGGDYQGRKDEMHFELQGGVKKLAAVVKKIKGAGSSGSSTTGTDTASKPADNSDPNRYTVRSESSIRRICLRATSGKDTNTTPHLIGLYQRQQWKPFPLTQDQIWGRGTDGHFRFVGQLQKALNEWKTDLPLLVVDGDHRGKTVERVKEWQTRNHGGAYKGKIDGWAGPDMCSALGVKSYKKW